MAADHLCGIFAIFARRRRWANALGQALACLWLLPVIGFAAGSLPSQAQIFDPTFQNWQFDSAVAALKRGDNALALEGFEALAEQGDLAAQYNAGWMRAKGLGAPVDFIAAYQWFALVAQAGQEKAITALRELRRQMPPGDIAEGERRAEAWRARRQATAP